MEKLFTVKEVATYLKMTNQAIYNFITAGKLKAIKVGGSVRIKECDLNAFIEREKNEN